MKDIWREVRGNEPLGEFLILCIRAWMQAIMGFLSIGALFFLLYLIARYA